MDKELLIKAAMAGFAASKEGFNGECAFEFGAPDDKEIRHALGPYPRDPDIIRPVLERALKLAGLI